MTPIHYRLFDDTEWVYPDTPVEGSSINEIHLAKGGHALCQILTDEILETELPFSLSVSGASGITLRPYQMFPVGVSQNSNKRYLNYTTTDYEAVKDFVTRKAPFEVFDGLMELSATASAGRAAFALRFFAAPDAPEGTQTIQVLLTFGERSVALSLALTVHKATILPSEKSPFRITNWINPLHIVEYHNVELYSDEYWAIYREYLLHAKDIRNNNLLNVAGETFLGGEVIRDESGAIVDFDLSNLEKALKIGEELGYPYLSGGCVAHFHRWTDKDLFLLWDPSVLVSSAEGYRQMVLYFTRVKEMIERNGWQDCYYQPLVDEPQVDNAPDYFRITNLFRRTVPGIPIEDPSGYPEALGGPDIYCVHYTCYETNPEPFRAYQKAGYRMTYYSCGVPSGDTMNRVVDLPITAGRLNFWICHLYGFEGFLHWGYNVTPEYKDTNVVAGGIKWGDKTYFPAGNSSIVYVKDGKLCESMRSQNQLFGAEDYELLLLLKKQKPEEAEALLLRACRNLNDYERESDAFQAIRKDILTALDRA